MTLQASPVAPAENTPASSRVYPAAHVITSDDEAISVARHLASRFAVDAARRDRERTLPLEELDACSQAGLWAMTVPRTYGSAQVSYATVGQVFAILAAADPSIAQIQQNHNSAVFWLWKTGSEQQRAHFLGAILRGARFGNANVDAEPHQSPGPRMSITPDGDGYRLSGRKLYATGALFADYVSTIGQDDRGRRIVAIVPAEHPGMTIVDDWESFGQKTTASGTVTFDDVRVPALNVLPIYRSYDEWPQNAITQISHVGIDAGIARAAIDATIAFIRQRTSNPIAPPTGPIHSDPYVIVQLGELKTRLHAAEAMMDRAGREIDLCLADPQPDSIANASIAVAEAKALTTEIAIEASNKLFELAGTRSTHPSFNLDRHWRNARVHTLHDPVRWKLHLVGNYHLNHVLPARHSWN